MFISGHLIGIRLPFRWPQIEWISFLGIPKISYSLPLKGNKPKSP